MTPGLDRLPVLLIHGGGYDNAAISWSKVFGPLAADRLVIAPDLPGFGYTEGIPITGRVDDLADLVIMSAGRTGSPGSPWPASRWAATSPCTSPSTTPRRSPGWCWSRPADWPSV